MLSAQWPKRSAQLDPFYPRARGPWPTCALREPRPRAPGHNLGLDRECAFPPGPKTARPRTSADQNPRRPVSSETLAHLSLPPLSFTALSGGGHGGRRGAAPPRRRPSPAPVRSGAAGTWPLGSPLSLYTTEWRRALGGGGRRHRRPPRRRARSPVRERAAVERPGGGALCPKIARMSKARRRRLRCPCPRDGGCAPEIRRLCVVFPARSRDSGNGGCGRGPRWVPPILFVLGLGFLFFIRFASKLLSLVLSIHD